MNSQSPAQESTKPTQSIESSKEPKHHLPLKVLLIALVFILGSIVGAYGYQWYQMQNESVDEMSDIMVEPQPSQAPSVTTDTMSGWQTYRDDEYGFEFMYPGDWEIKSDEKQSQEMPQHIADMIKHNSTDYYPLISIFYYENPGNVSLEEFSNQLEASNITGDPIMLWRPEDVESTTQQGITVFYQQEHYCVSICQQYVVVDDGGIYSFIKNEGPSAFVDGGRTQYDQLFGQILSTFRFVDEENPSLTKICSNQTLQFSLKIPNNWMCDSQEDSVVDGRVGWVDISSTSGEFSVHISNLGRGGPCGDGPTTNVCNPEPFYSSNTVVLKNYFDTQVSDYEIFGSIQNDANPWISIRPTDSTRKMPTKEGEQLLKEVFDTVEII